MRYFLLPMDLVLFLRTGGNKMPDGTRKTASSLTADGFGDPGVDQPETSSIIKKYVIRNTSVRDSAIENE